MAKNGKNAARKVALKESATDGSEKRKKKGIIETEMHEFKHGKLHSGSKHGPIVKDRKQAIAIGLSEAKKSKKSKKK